MKTLITYYSYSGNTDKVAKIFADKLGPLGEVTLQRLKPAEEITGFAAQCCAALMGRRAKLGGDAVFDASHFDLVILGCPVWAFAPVPAMNSFLDSVNGLHGKRVIVLLTSGSGLGVNKCFRHIGNVLRSKGVSSIDEINIPDRKQSDRDFIADSISRYI